MKKLEIRQIFILKLTSNVSIKVTEANINLKTVPFEIIVCQKKLYSVGCASLYSDSEGMLVWLQSSDHDGSYNWLILRRMANILNLFCIRHQSICKKTTKGCSYMHSLTRSSYLSLGSDKCFK